MSDYQDRINDAVDNAVDNINNPYLLGYIRALDYENARLTRERDAALAVVEVAREWDAHWQPSQASSLGRMLDWKLHEALAAYDQERSDG